MGERITIHWDSAKRERPPMAVGEQRDLQPDARIGYKGKTYRFASLCQEGSIVYADFEEEPNPKPGKVL
jgi:hypothetical protein